MPADDALRTVMASYATTLNGLANQACQRCYKRKKKCDRTLPGCIKCANAKVNCSFEVAETETAIFELAYVHGLENKVLALEQELKQYQAVIADYAQCGDDLQDAARVSSRTGTSPDTSSGQLESGLKLLSMEAVAERYVGSSSGISFARLTQAVLKRLRPDIEPFSFPNRTPESSSFSKVQESSSESTRINSDTPKASQDGLDESSLPPENHARRLVEYYWCHSHTLYPFMRKVWFMDNLNSMYHDSNKSALETSHTWMYTMWMVLAIGSTSLSAIMNSEEIESVNYWKQAMVHFDFVLEDGNMAALNGILLQVSYSFFNQIGPNTWYLIGMGVRIALGLGMGNISKVPLPKHVQEYRARMFFSLYMMDRLVSITLGRPFGLQDEDIEIEPFAAIDDEEIVENQMITQLPLTVSASAVPLHILKLRKVAGEIFQQVYSRGKAHVSQTEKDKLIRGLHERLIDWRRSMPFPLPEPRTHRVPQLTTAWYDLNYYNHLIMLYRPSPLCPTITVDKVSTLANAAVMSLRQIGLMHSSCSFSFNWLNLYSLFTTTLALIYAITAQPRTLSSYLEQTNALQDLRLAADLLETFGKKFPAALKYRSMVQDVIARLSIHLPSSPARIRYATNTSSAHCITASQCSANNVCFTSYPIEATGNPAYDTLATQLLSPATGNHSPRIDPTIQAVDRLPIEFAMSGTSGFFDDFAAQDLVTGFDESEDEFLNNFGAHGNVEGCM